MNQFVYNLNVVDDRGKKQASTQKQANYEINLNYY